MKGVLIARIMSRVRLPERRLIDISDIALQCHRWRMAGSISGNVLVRLPQDAILPQAARVARANGKLSNLNNTCAYEIAVSEIDDI